MKLSNAEIFNAKESFEKLLATKLPVKTSYELLKMTTKLNEQLGVIDKVRSRLIQEYGKEDEKRKGVFRVTPDCPEYSKFLSEFGELLKQEVDINIQKVKLPETLEIEASVLMALDKFVTI